jgi:hypothetical protein
MISECPPHFPFDFLQCRLYCQELVVEAVNEECPGNVEEINKPQLKNQNDHQCTHFYLFIGLIIRSSTFHSFISFISFLIGFFKKLYFQSKLLAFYPLIFHIPHSICHIHQIQAHEYI